MRRSSRWILLVIVLLLGVTAVAMLASAERKAPPMTPATAQALLDRGKSLLERRDVEGILGLFTRDARILDRTAIQIRPLLEQAMREVGSSHLTVAFSHLDVKPEGGDVQVSVDADILQHFASADASYFRPRLHLMLRKEKIARLFGLATDEEWRIYRLDSDQSLELPPP